MIIPELEHFFYMGGYAFYVWSAYALALTILMANIFIPITKRRELLQKIARQARKGRAPHS